MPISLRTSCSTQALETGEAKLWVLLVGVNQYQDNSLPALCYSAPDCQGLGKALAEATRAFPNKETIAHHDFSEQLPKLATVRASLRRVVAEAKAQDTVLFYFSGHGVLDAESQQSVLCLSDTDKSNLVGTGLPVQGLLQTLDQCEAHAQLVWLDACHSGDMTMRGARGEAAPVLTRPDPTPTLVHVLRQRAARSKGFYALLSCDQGQRSWEFPELGHGVFTYYLMRGLRGEAADAQGVIDADGLYKYVYQQTLQYIDKTNQQVRLINQQKRSQGKNDFYPEYSQQTPKRIVEGIGELVLGLKPDKTRPQHPRQALVVQGSTDNQKAIALSKVLAGIGGFDLGYWCPPAKSEAEPQRAIHTCLHWQSSSETELFTSFTTTKKTATALLYLRGEIEETENGEAWLVLSEGVKISRSWLRQQLRRSDMTQQILILDCPGATTLADWVEDLKQGPEQGQCLIAAAAPATEPDQFAQALLQTLVIGKRQTGLLAAEWIAQLKTHLAETQITLHAYLSGNQGLIEVLSGPKSELNSSEAVKPSGSSGLASTPARSQSQVSWSLSPEQYSSLEQELADLVGPIAPTLLRQGSARAPNPKELVENLLPYLPAKRRIEFEWWATSLLENSAIRPQTRSDHSSSTASKTTGLKTQDSRLHASQTLSGQAISEGFVHQCERELAELVGPIATFLVRKVLQTNPRLSQIELVESLVTAISEPQKASEFRQRLIA
ncbi:caspase domain-containing protein [Leptolyngbya sp. FACHB-261]|uniref:caspase family protein n=1 Tax=Leptolyngbya sp. FACHB-261 TaxID=2692806 RepID=UPI0016851DCA|nr:caspase domain-containing protein [Leptolyngbya sp. FACHB-261]MBD2101058.1 caspase family protein [Leptolyngbya sp. FACHB-261]